MKWPWHLKVPVSLSHKQQQQVADKMQKSRNKHVRLAAQRWCGRSRTKPSCSYLPLDHHHYHDKHTSHSYNHSRVTCGIGRWARKRSSTIPLALCIPWQRTQPHPALFHPKNRYSQDAELYPSRDWKKWLPPGPRPTGYQLPEVEKE